MSIKNKKFSCLAVGTECGHNVRSLFDNFYKFDTKTKEEIEDEYYYIYQYTPITDKLKQFIENEDIKGYESCIFFSISSDDVDQQEQFKKIHYQKYNTSSPFALMLCNIEWEDEEL
jgi:hypothetical protein